MTRARVLLVEDDAALAELVSWHLEREDFEVERTADGEEAILLARENPPDLVLLDWMIEGVSGIEVCRQLRRMGDTANVPIIMLTARGEEEDRVRGLETGADDYVTKPFSPRELNARIKAVLRRRAPQMTDDPIEIAGLHLDPTTHRVTGHNVHIPLGPTEFKLLHFFMTNPERVHSRTQLLDKVWGDRVFVEDRTVDVHIRRLRNALVASSHQEMIQTVRGSGYRFSVHTDPGN